ncbi:MAG TPA: BlaI/MecI/CopY family transcriptional regulator [Chthoniobacter sp.]|nr:BlaI/MecI/CopY family transcriptional regulator [Chthoniobacter sp.]
MQPSPPKPTDAELAILQALWRGGPSTVKEVQERMEEGTGYTTVLKFLQIMAEKGLVRRNEEQRAHVYEAAVSEADTQDRLVTALLKKAFGGSTSKLVLQALASKKASPDELAEIRRLINKLSKE